MDFLENYKEEIIVIMLSIMIALNFVYFNMYGSLVGEATYIGELVMKYSEYTKDMSNM
jgi:hypothetical protein